MTKDEYFETADKRRPTNLLNHIWTLGTNVTSTADEAVAAAVPRGHGMRFDHSIFQYDAPPGDYYLVVASTAKPEHPFKFLDPRNCPVAGRLCRHAGGTDGQR